MHSPWPKLIIKKIHLNSHSSTYKHWNYTFLINVDKTLKSYRSCIKIRQNDYVQNDVNTASKIWLRNGTKNNNTSSHMLLDHCYAFGLILLPSGKKKKFLEEENPPPPLHPARMDSVVCNACVFISALSGPYFQLLLWCQYTWQPYHRFYSSVASPAHLESIWTQT